VFDISFFELLVVAVVGLVVIGPERLPETVRGISLWIGRLKRSLRETRTELERQIGADDIRRQLHNEEVMRSLEKAKRDIETTVQDTLTPIENALAPAEKNNPAAAYAPEEALPDHAHMDELPRSETPAADIPQPSSQEKAP
jgi:sec-independent protein translocase protein TatB